MRKLCWRQKQLCLCPFFPGRSEEMYSRPLCPRFRASSMHALVRLLHCPAADIVAYPRLSSQQAIDNRRPSRHVAAQIHCIRGRSAMEKKSFHYSLWSLLFPRRRERKSLLPDCPCALAAIPFAWTSALHTARERRKRADTLRGMNARANGRQGKRIEHRT